MLCVVFRVKDIKFVIDTSYVVEIIHYVNVVGSVESNTNFEGIINYRGELIPLLDFCFYYSGITADKYIHSRIIVLESLDERRLGMLAEGVVETIRLSRNHFVENPVDQKHYAYISGLWSTPEGIFKNVDVPLLFDMCFQGANYG